MPPRKRRSYTAEYKVEAAHRVIDSGRTISEVARELGIDAGMLSVWVKDERRRIAAAEAHGDAPLDAGERTELQRLRRQVGEPPRCKCMAWRADIVCTPAAGLARADACAAHSVSATAAAIVAMEHSRTRRPPRNGAASLHS